MDEIISKTSFDTEHRVIEGKEKKRCKRRSQMENLQRKTNR